MVTISILLCKSKTCYLANDWLLIETVDYLYCNSRKIHWRFNAKRTCMLCIYCLAIFSEKCLSTENVHNIFLVQYIKDVSKLKKRKTKTKQKAYYIYSRLSNLFNASWVLYGTLRKWIFEILMQGTYSANISSCFFFSSETPRLHLKLKRTPTENYTECFL